MNRRIAYLSLLLAVVCGFAAGLVENANFEAELGSVLSVAVETVAVQALLVAAVVLGVVGAYTLLLGALLARTEDKRRRHNLRNVLRFAFVVVGIVGVFGVLTQQYLGLFFSLGIVGFAVTFALQQPLFSLIGWLYIMTKQPYSVGDRVAIEGSRGDVVEVNFSRHDAVWQRRSLRARLLLPGLPARLERTLRPGGIRDPPRVRPIGDDRGGRRLPRRRDGAGHRTLPGEPRRNARRTRGPGTAHGERQTGGSRGSNSRTVLVHPRRGQRVRNDLYERIWRG